MASRKHRLDLTRAAQENSQRAENLCRPKPDKNPARKEKLAAQSHHWPWSEWQLLVAGEEKASVFSNVIAPIGGPCFGHIVIEGCSKIIDAKLGWGQGGGSGKNRQ